MSKSFQENNGDLQRYERRYRMCAWNDRFRLGDDIGKKRQMLSNITVFLLILMVGSFCVSEIASGVPSVFGYRLFFIMSESMEPTIRTHQFVVGKVIVDDVPKVGDVVAYEKGDGPVKKMVIHRIVGVADDGKYILQGDHNEEADAPVERGRIKYKVLGVE